MKFKPRPYQKTAIETICVKPATALFMQMGLGKTVCALSAIDELIYDYLLANKALIIAPKSVTKIVWPDELQKWDHLKRLSYVVLHGPKKDRLLRKTHRTDLTIINYDGLQWLEDNRKQLPKYDILILDESTFIKTQSSKRSGVARRFAKQIPKRIIMTGAPTPNSLIDLWHQIYILDRGERLGYTSNNYKCSYFIRDAVRLNKWHLKKHSRKVIANKIRDISVVLRAKDHLQMPKLIENDISLHLNNGYDSGYKSLERDFYVELNKTQDLTVFNASALSQKLRQYISGFVYHEDGPVHIHTQKLELFKDLLDALNGEPLLCAIQFKEEVRMIRQYLRKDIPVINSDTKDKDREKHIREWNNGSLPLLVVHPASAAHGLNIQFGGFHMLWYSLTWNLDHYDQLIARLWRSGQRSSKVFMHRIVVRNTIDETIAAVLKKKNKDQNMLINYVKAWENMTHAAA